MRKAFSIIMIFLQSFVTWANEDSLIVYSILDQAHQLQHVDSSNRMAQKAMKYAKKQQYLDGMLDVAKFIGTQYSRAGQQEKAIAYYQQLVSEENFDKKQLSTAFNQIGIYHVFMGHYDSTEYYFLKALNIRQLLNDSIGVGASYNNLGNVTMAKGDYDQATSYFINALKIRELVKDSAGIASSTNNLGMIYYKQRKFEEAIPYYREALSINTLLHNPEKAVLILNNLGNIYDEMNQLDSSLYYYKQSIQKAEEVGDARLIAISYGNMGVTLQKMGHYKKAQHHLNKALKIRIESDDLEGQSILYNNLAALYVDLKTLDSAAYYFDKSLALSIQINNKEISRDNYLGLSKVYEKQQHYELSFLAFQNYINIKDSMLNEVTNEQIAELQTQYETQKKEKEIAEQQTKISWQQLRVKKRNFLLLGGGISIIFMLVLGGLMYRQQKRKQLQLVEENRLKDQIAQIRLQNKLHEERLNISSNLNDNIGSQLTFIISSVDNMKHLFKFSDEKLSNKLTEVANFTRITMVQLRDTIWALNKDEISFDDLKSRLYNYLENAQLAQEQTQFKFNATLSTNYQLNPIQGVSIYRVVQEALNNAIKYAAATQVELNISETKDQVILFIEDDGIGFKMHEVKLGNGLENMRNRAQAIQAELQVVSTPEKGTKIVLTLNKDTLNAV